MSDRTVHGLSPRGWEIARYDRAGKWYLERKGEPRRRVGLDEATRLAAWGDFYPDRPGGTAFDSRVRKLREATVDRKDADPDLVAQADAIDAAYRALTDKGAR